MNKIVWEPVKEKWSFYELKNKLLIKVENSVKVQLKDIIWTKLSLISIKCACIAQWAVIFKSIYVFLKNNRDEINNFTFINSIDGIWSFNI